MSAALAVPSAVTVPVRGSSTARPDHLRLCGAGDIPSRPVAVPGPSDTRTLHRPASAEFAAPLRLTRRGVVVLTLAVAALGAALFWIAARSVAANGDAGGAVAGAGISHGTVVVRAGDTLWSIADRVAPQVDPRAEVAELARLNHIVNAELQPGQVLRVH